jgi:hypothetical protein
MLGLLSDFVQVDRYDLQALILEVPIELVHPRFLSRG